MAALMLPAAGATRDTRVVTDHSRSMVIVRCTVRNSGKRVPARSASGASPAGRLSGCLIRVNCRLPATSVRSRSPVAVQPVVLSCTCRGGAGKRSWNLLASGTRPLRVTLCSPGGSGSQSTPLWSRYR